VNKMDYEIDVKVDLDCNGEVEIYDKQRWLINKGRVEWIGGKCEEEFGRYLEELVEDVFNAKVEIGGRVGWEGEDDEDFGYYEIDGKNIKCNFQKKM